ncbi:MAG: hypothetical protein FWD82_07140 [Defluviitaleaceae bacterium]|nr:hypothetical protein [Defluviitaleaceae bacterium]
MAAYHNAFGPYYDYTFADVQTYQAELKALICRLFALGGTNFGDGVRRGYQALTDNPIPSTGRPVKEYFIFMTDGQINMFTETSATNNTFFEGVLGSRDVPRQSAASGPNPGVGVDDFFAGTVHFAPPVRGGSAQHSENAAFVNRSLAYMEMFTARLLQRPATVPEVLSMQTYFVILAREVTVTTASRASVLLGLGPIAYTGPGTSISWPTAVLPPNVYQADTASQLIDAFNDIATSIVLDLWHVRGPNLY